MAEAADGASAGGRALHRPEVVLLDIGLPDMSGLTVAERLTSEPGGPAVVLTSTHDAADFGDAIDRSGAGVRAQGLVLDRGDLGSPGVVASIHPRRDDDEACGSSSRTTRSSFARARAAARGRGHEIVAQSGDAEDLLRRVRAHKPDVAIIDVRMPPDNADDGLRAALTIRDELPEVGILLLSQYVEDRYLGELLAAAPRGSGTC